MTDNVRLREVGMRDGLQSLPPILTAEQKTGQRRRISATPRAMAWLSSLPAARKRSAPRSGR